MKELCYYCGRASTSREHVPPLCLFPKSRDLEDGIDYRKNLITVPSCDLHNSLKSKNDEYLQLILVHGYFNNSTAREHFNTKMLRAIMKRPALLSALYKEKKPVTIDNEPTVAVEIDRLRFNEAIVHISQGLCYYHTCRPWSKKIEIHTPLLLSIGDPDDDKVNTLVTNVSKAAIEYLKETETYGENPDVFQYQILVEDEKQRMLCRMIFYRGFEILAISDPR